MKLSVGVVGAGHLGKIHLRLLSELSDLYELVGFYDHNEATSAEVYENQGVKPFASLEELVKEVEVVVVVTPTTSHFRIAELAIKKGKHVFIEKPLSETLEEAKQLLSLSEEAGVKVMVGHVERFNPAYRSVESIPLNPMFIEAHRLAPFNPRGTEVSVVLDLMIHDLDIILHIVKAEIRKIYASGVAVISESPDIANVRIEFDNGCVANITASRISMKQMRKIRLFQMNSYIGIDLFEKQTEVINLSPEPRYDGAGIELDAGEGRKKYLLLDYPDIPKNNAIRDELISFHAAIQNNTEPIVNLSDGYRALDVAYKIMSKIERNGNFSHIQ